MTRPNRRELIRDRANALAGHRHAVQAATAAVTPAEGETTTPESAAAATVAELWLYGVVGGWWWGFDAETVADALRAMPDDVTEIRVRVHSPGGDAHDGIAIGNLLRNHPARVVIVVDGIAASAASVLALGGDELIMSPGSQFMIHDPSMLTYGNEAQLLADAAWIGKQAQVYAELYQQTAGGTVDEWRELMAVDNNGGTWYTAAETVEAGFATRVGTLQSISPPPPDPAGDTELDDTEVAARAAFDLDVLIHPAARAAWTSTPGALPRAPKPPTASADGKTHTEGIAMSLSDAALKTLKAKLGVTAEDADEATIMAALDEVLDEQTEPTPTAATTTATATVPEGMVLMDAQTAAALRTSAAQGAQAFERQQTAHREATITAAVGAGKFPPARADHYRKLWAADDEGTEQLIASLEPGLVPVAEIGHDATTTDGDLPTVAADALGELGGMFGLTAEELSNG